MTSIAVDPQHIEGSLRRQFPDLEAVEPVRVLGSGFRSMIVETAGGIIFRIGKNLEAAEGYAKEIRLLPLIRPALPVSIPELLHYAGRSPDFPFGVMGYRKLLGISLQRAVLTAERSSKLASDLARCLVALHGVPVDTLEPVGLPSEPVRSVVAGWPEIVLPVLRERLMAGELDRLARWWHGLLSDSSLDEYEPALIHGDLWYEHILVDDLSVIGILDFESARIGDPAQDLAMQRYLGAQFSHLVMAAYMEQRGLASESLLHRVRRLWELREFSGLVFSIRWNDEAELRDSIRKLRAGPILHPATDR